MNLTVIIVDGHISSVEKHCMFECGRYEEAARQMAKAAFIVHTPETASYDWDVVQSSWGGTVTRGADTPENALTFTGWVYCPSSEI